MASWTIETLGSVAEMATDKISVNKVTAESYVSTENMLPDRGGVGLAPKIPPSGNVNAFCPGDVLFSNIRTYFKKVWLAPRHGGASSDVIIFRPRGTQRIESQFLFYVLSSDAFIESTVTASKGTKMPRGDKDAMQRYEFALPPLPIQRRIAGILSAYDELIENSQRRIKILEAMARALYREWFVHFRFPGHESVPRVPSPLGDIPQGWEVKSVQHFGKVITGKTPSKANPDFYGDAVPFVKTPDMHGNMFILGTSEKLSAAGAESQANKTLPAGAICVSCIGTIGVVSITTEDCQTNQQINSLVLKNRASCEFLVLRLQDAKQTLENLGANGATMGNVNKGKFEAMELVAPPVELLVEYQSIAQPMFEEILTLSRQIQNLRRTRDLLLPRLLSGQVTLAEN
jgi:type I restriction enzyme S subunit